MGWGPEGELSTIHLQIQEGQAQNQEDLKPLGPGMQVCGETRCSPTRLAMSTPVTRCSRTSWIWGLSPGAMAVRMTVNALTWVTERTVAAVSQGNPNNPQRPPREPIKSRSRWKPEPLSSLRAFWLTMSLRGRERRSQLAGTPVKARDSRPRLEGREESVPWTCQLPLSRSQIKVLTLQEIGAKFPCCKHLKAPQNPDARSYHVILVKPK